MMDFANKCFAASKRLDDEIKPAEYFLVIENGDEAHVSYSLSEERLVVVLRRFLEEYDARGNN